MIIVVMHLSKAIECAPAKNEPYVNYGLWVIVAYHCMFIS